MRLTGVNLRIFSQKSQHICFLKIAKRFSSYFGQWVQPLGYDTEINIYNAAVGKKVPLILKNKGFCTWYMCGPTVYADSHIGHASCFVKFDTIIRIIERIFGINVLLTIGITDIDDKIIKKSTEMNLSSENVAKKYEFEFFKDMEAMNVQRPAFVVRVTDNIPLIVSFIEKLIKKEYAYVTEKGNVYFIVSKSASAEVMTNMPEVSIIDPLKKDQRDFALWKASKDNEPFWVSPWGNGRPGWHIECSAMASKIFGSNLDIHSGGYDLMFPHHCNEKSQSEAYHGCPQWVNYWLHSGLLQVENNEKMSKSVQNTISISDFLQEHSVNDFRILCLQSLYRKNISYCPETLSGAKGLHKKLNMFLNDCENSSESQLQMAPGDEENLVRKLRKVQEDVRLLLADDFSTAEALLTISEFIDTVNSCLEKAKETETGMTGISSILSCAKYVDSLLEDVGVNIITKKKLRREHIEAINAVVKFRNDVRLVALGEIEKEKAAGFIMSSYRIYQNTIEIMPKDLTDNFTHVSEVVYIFYEQVIQFISKLPKGSVDKESHKGKKDEFFTLFSFCDSIRSSLNKYGISIKDKKLKSTWFPLTTFKI